MMIEIPPGPDWKSQLTPEQRAALPGIDDPPPKPRYQRRPPPRDHKTLGVLRETNNTIRNLRGKLLGDVRGSNDAMIAAVREIVEDATIPRPLHVRSSLRRKAGA
jgi:hypothetical protein